MSAASAKPQPVAPPAADAPERTTGLRLPWASLQRLARRVAAGEVVFFIGAGFSRDSEQNSAERLIGRLLARFDAITSTLAAPWHAVAADPALAQRVRLEAGDLRASLLSTFALDAGRWRVATASNAGRLAKEYFTINDWLVSAFASAVDCLLSLPDRQPVLALIRTRELRLLRTLRDERVPLDRVPLDEMRLEPLRALDGLSRGKALFLETMGFANPRIMHGPELEAGVERFEDEMRDVLLPRHHVLARLAREGLCPTMLTTNFDLLLESAYRLAGFAPSALGAAGHGRPAAADGAACRLDADLAPTTHSRLARVARATDFFGRGDDHRAAFLVKLHGCAGVYRGQRESPSWQDYLPAIVFTYREIQNWREDSWSRDLLRTLLRTRTIVFCGYSVIDPVLHDTIRTVYEEMARKLPDPGTGPDARGAGAAGEAGAPAFFFGVGERREFHGQEILRAASRAVGVRDPVLTRHPNYLQFQFRKAGGSARRPYPDIDDGMQALFHLAFRELQERCLDSDLRRVAGAVLGHPAPESEARAVLRAFQDLREQEEREATGGGEAARGRAALQRLTSWTSGFQAALLRELATAEAILRHQGPALEVQSLRRPGWYYPALQHADWTAWTTVVEIALRRMIAAWRETGSSWAADSVWVRSGAGAHPFALYSRGERGPTPSRVTIRLGGSQRTAAVANTPPAIRRQIVWEVLPKELPWRRDKTGEHGAHRERESAQGIEVAATPPAREIWRWAAAAAPDRTRLAAWLGDADG